MAQQSVQFQPQAESKGFKPVEQVNALPLIQENHQRFINAERVAADLESEYARTRMMVDGNNWEQLAKFSKTAASYVEDWVKRDNENKEIGAMYDALLEGTDVSVEAANENQAEQTAISEGVRQGEQVSTLANQIEQETGDIALGQQVRQQFGRLAAGVAGEQAMLMKAQTTYGGFLAAFVESNARIRLNGQLISVRDAIASGDSRMINAVVAAGRGEFIRANKLQYATKANFVKYLSNTIIATEGSITTGLVREGIKQQRQSAIAGIEGLAYDLTRTTDSVGVGDLFNEISGQFFRNNTGMSRGEANEAAVKALIEGFTDTGNVEALEALLDVRQVPNQEGTELRRRYGNLIYDAIDKANGRQDQLDERTYNDTLDSLEEQLTGTNDPTERQQLIDAAADELEAAGLHRRARELRGQYNELSADGAHAFNATQAEEAITNGEITDPKAIDKMYRRGLISLEEKQRLEGLIKQEDFSKDPVVKSVVDTFADSAEAYFLQQVGLKKDAFGNTIDPLTGETPALSPDQARLVVGQMRRDIERFAVSQARNSEGVSGGQLNTALNNTLSAWVKDNLKTQGGKYFVGDLRTEGSNGLPAMNPDAKKRVEGYVQPNWLSRVSSIQSNQNLKPVDFSNSVQPNGRLPSVVVQQFRPNRGDKVFDNQEVRQIFTDWEAGRINPLLKSVADQLGKTPLALLNQQLTAHGFPATAIPVGVDTPTPAAPRRVSNAVQGATYLIQRHGLPVRGAAWLAGNISQENGAWNGQRAYWTLGDGAGQNGGLVSWNRGRLAAAERFFGKPLTQVPNNQQLDFMLNEMRTNPQYQEAYRIFNNPRATETQLLRASYIYWGYGEEGNRAQYARQTEQALRNRSNRQPNQPRTTATGTGQQRAIQVGRQLLSMGTKMWQHPNFDLDRGYVAAGGARVGTHSPNSHHYANQAMDIPASHNSPDQLRRTFNYLVANQQRLGIVELFWDGGGYYKNGQRIGGAGSNTIPNHDTHIHIAFS